MHLVTAIPYVTLIGKGRKSRNVPLIEKIVKYTAVYLKEFHLEANENPVLYSSLNGKTHKLSTDSISLVLKTAANNA